MRVIKSHREQRWSHEVFDVGKKKREREISHVAEKHTEVLMYGRHEPWPRSFPQILVLATNPHPAGNQATTTVHEHHLSIRQRL
jgi:hypothetical protein